MIENKYGYHRSWCDYCERITDHEDTRCLICTKFDGEDSEDFTAEQEHMERMQNVRQNEESI